MRPMKTTGAVMPAENDRFRLTVNRRSTLSEIEELLSRLAASHAEEVEVWLPRDIGTTIFIESRVTALIATAARNRRLRIIDWIQSGREGHEKRFGCQVEGIAALQYANEIRNAQQGEVPIRLDRVQDRLESQEGIAEDDPNGRTMTYCAFDQDVSQQPLAFARVRNKAEFGTQFIKRFKRAFQKDRVVFTTAPDTPIHRLSDFVYELFENTFSHGSLDRNGKVMPGFRFFRLQRHVAVSREQLSSRAEGFPELQEYFERVAEPQGTSKFYEISISDHGLGIVDRFVASRPDYRFQSDADDERLREIIDKALSSKLHQAGAGHGIGRALKAISDLKGFVSLRLGDIWLCGGSTIGAGETGAHGLVRVRSGLAKVAGTHFNVIIVAD
jgi:hypothetical protein